MASHEMGSVLIAVNSYVQAPGFAPLPHADDVLSDYVKTFYSHLYFRVKVLFDYTKQQFWDAFEEFFANPTGNHVVVVLYGHGAVVERKEYLGTYSDNLPIHEVAEQLQELCPRLSKYLFLDLCRSKDKEADRCVYQFVTPPIYVAHSTLLFNPAEANLWSRLMAHFLTEPTSLTSVIRCVDDNIAKRYGGSAAQQTDIQQQGTLGETHFRERAIELAQGSHLRESLPKYLRGSLETAQQRMKPHKLSGPSGKASLKIDQTDTWIQASPLLFVGDQPTKSQQQQPVPKGHEDNKGEADLPVSSSPPPNKTQPPSTTTSEPVMAAVAEPKGLDAAIASVNDILKYEDDMIGQMSLLGTTLRLGRMTNAILQGPGDLGHKGTLRAILYYYLSINEEATWNDLVEALCLPDFNNLVSKIKDDHPQALEDRIKSEDEIMKYENDMIARQQLVGTALGLESMTDTILKGKQAHDYLGQLTELLKYWMKITPKATWRMFVTALESEKSFNRLAYKIKEDHPEA